MLWLTLMVAVAAAPCTKREGCALDVATKTCNSALEPMRGESGPMPTSGDTCVCEAGGCKLFTVEPVACQSWKDCSSTREPFFHPVSSKKVPREHRRPVRPCKDSERDSVCDLNTRTCRVISWKC